VSEDSPATSAPLPISKRANRFTTNNAVTKVNRIKKERDTNLALTKAMTAGDIDDIGGRFLQWRRIPSGEYLREIAQIDD